MESHISNTDPIVHYNGLITIPNTALANPFLRLFNFQQSGTLCDTTIIAPEKVEENVSPEKENFKAVYAHSCIVAVGSTFLGSVLLKPTMIECAKKKIILKTISYSELLLCLKFIYGQKVSFIESRLDRIIEISKKLRIDDLTIKCNLLKDFLVKKEREKMLPMKSDSVQSLLISRPPNAKNNTSKPEVKSLLKNWQPIVNNNTSKSESVKSLLINKQPTAKSNNESDSVNYLAVKKQSIVKTIDSILSVMKSNNMSEISDDEHEEILGTDDNWHFENSNILNKIDTSTKCNEPKTEDNKQVVYNKDIISPKLLQTTSCQEETKIPSEALPFSNVALLHNYATPTNPKKGKKSQNKEKTIVKKQPLSAEEKKHRNNMKAKKSRVCKHCDKTFKNYFWYKKHIRAVKGLFLYCKYCEKPFLLSDQLKLHERRHKKDKIFLCDYCDFRAVTKAEIKFHNTVHIINKKYTCEICGLSFKAYNTLSSHRSSMHDIADKRRENAPKCYRCNECGLTKSHFRHVKMHLRSHVQGSHYSCKLCGKGYNAMVRMRKHLFDGHNITLPKLTTTLEKENILQNIYSKYIKKANNLDNVVTNYDPVTDTATLSLGNPEESDQPKLDIGKSENFSADTSSTKLQNQEGYTNVIEDTITFQQNNFINLPLENELETEQY